LFETEGMEQPGSLANWRGAGVQPVGRHTGHGRNPGVSPRWEVTRDQPGNFSLLPPRKSATLWRLQSRSTRPPGSATLVGGTTGPLGRTTDRSGRRTANRTNPRSTCPTDSEPHRDHDSPPQGSSGHPAHETDSRPAGPAIPPSPAQRAGTCAPDHVVDRPKGPTIHPVPARFVHVPFVPEAGRRRFSRGSGAGSRNAQVVIQNYVTEHTPVRPHISPSRSVVKLPK
jgi:hypothetical protein